MSGAALAKAGPANIGAAGPVTIDEVRANTGVAATGRDGAATTGAALATTGAATTWGVFLTTALKPLIGSAT